MHRSLVVSFLAAALAALVWAQPPQVPQIASHLTDNGLRADVSFLASDALEGRGTPSRGLDIAAEYVAAQFRRAGLEPAGDDGYFENATFESVTPSVEGLRFAIEVGGMTFKADAAQMAIQEAGALDLDHTPVVTATMDTAKALDELTAPQVRGKVLLAIIPPGSPYAVMRAVRTAAERLEPALVVLVRASSRGAMSAARLRDPSARGFHGPMLTVWDPAIRDAAADGESATASVHIAAPKVQSVKVRNVIGVLRGSDPVLKDRYLLLTAHYDHLGIRGKGEGDHIYNGANDDASGTASVIEIAGALSALPTRPKRTIVFMTFFGEELGLVGSDYYAHHPVFPLSQTVADINLEQLGRTDDTQGPHVGMFNLTGFDFTTMSAVFRQAGEQAGIQVVNDENNGDKYFAASDNLSLAQVGVPSTTISVTYEFPDYHQAGDEWQKLDYANMAKVDTAIALAAYKIADSTGAPQWNTANPKTEPYAKARGAGQSAASGPSNH
jgi:hypothetical protein